MKINYEETITLLSWGFFLDESPQKDRFNSVYGVEALEKVKEFEAEQFTSIMKRDTVSNILETIERKSSEDEYIADLEKGLRKTFERADVNSDVIVSLSLNDMKVIASELVDRKHELQKDDEYRKRSDITFAELNRTANKIHKDSDFNISKEVMKTIVSTFNEKNILDSDIPLLNKIKSELSISSFLENKNKTSPKMRP